MKINIKGKEYNFEVRSWWGPMYKFEDLMSKGEHPERTFNPSLTFHIHVMFYAVLLCDNEQLDLTLDDFLAALEDLTLCNSMSRYYAERVAILTQGQQQKAGKGQSKKKR